MDEGYCQTPKCEKTTTTTSQQMLQMKLEEKMGFFVDLFFTKARSQRRNQEKVYSTCLFFFKWQFPNGKEKQV